MWQVESTWHSQDIANKSGNLAEGKGDRADDRANDRADETGQIGKAKTYVFQWEAWTLKMDLNMLF
jgi:hypothetical protein